MTAPAEKHRPTIEFDHHGAEYNQDPFAAYAQLREQAPVAWTAAHGGYWVLSRAADVHRAAVEHATFSSGRLDEAPDEMRLLVPPIRTPFVPINEHDPPVFQQYRRLINKLLTPRAVEADLLPLVRRWTAACIDDFIEGGKADLIYEFAAPVPACVTLEWVGFQSGDWRRFAAAIHDYAVSPPGTAEHDAAMRAQGEMFELMRDAIVSRRKEPRDDLITYFLTCEVDGSPLTEEHIFGILQSIVSGGVDTTASLVGSTLVYLADHPDARRRLIVEPGLWETATEEFLRVFPPVMAHGRTVAEDTEVDDCPLRSGETVLVSWGSANFDETAFPDPQAVVLDRTPNRHYSFGMGPHRCAGSHLARMTFVEMMTQLLERLPDYEIVDRQQLRPYPDRAMFFGWNSVPARFTPGPRRVARSDAAAVQEAG